MDGTLAIDYRLIGDLIPYARNARTRSKAQVALIAGSIREYGFTNPVLVDGENGIIAGHGRVMTARKLGLMQVPVIELAHLTSTLLGFVLSVAVRRALFPAMGHDFGYAEDIVVATVFTAVSILRCYTVRRVFNALRGALP